MIIDKEVIRKRFNEQLMLLHEECPDWEDDFIRSHAKSTVIEEIEVEILRMFDQLHWETQEYINKSMGF